jgi:hypothetical protein
MKRWLAVMAASFVPAAVCAEPASSSASAQDRPPADYAPQPLTTSMSSPTGWGLRATIRGRSMDLGSPGSGWAADPGAGPKDIEAGYEWRDANKSAVIGFSQFDSSGGWNDLNAGDSRLHWGSQGVLGVGLTMKAR